MDVKVGVLSGGQRQAIALLMSTMTPIDFLILDEHTAALDPKTAELIMELTDKIVREKHLTTIMVTHNLRYAVAIVMTGPIAREISEEYGVDPKRSASLLDMFTSVGQGMIPYGAQLLSAATLTGLTPVDILPNLYYPVLMGICGVGAIFLRKR